MSAIKRIAVILENSASCQLDRVEREVPASDDQDSVIDGIASRIIEGFVFAVGDTIRILEVADGLEVPAAEAGK